jgi:xanthine/uracil/vitamin C permease (AzgA family)
MVYRIKGALLIGIFITSIISWPRPTAVTYFPHTPAGDDLFAFFKQVVTFHPLQHTGNALDVSVVCSISIFFTALISKLRSTTTVKAKSGMR